jgi:shikimate kinase
MVGHTVLVGLSGTGKTSVGRRIAALLSRPFVDADEAIEERTGRTVRGIFAADGEPAFRELEAKVMADLLAAPEPSVIAAGGGAVVTEATRKLLLQPDVFVVWLTATPEFLASRTGKKRHRPLLDGDPVAALSRLAAERAGWYDEVGDVAFDVQPAHHAAPKQEAKDNIARILAGLVRDRESPRARDHIVLIGPMASGKTSVGRIVADVLGRPLIDSDDQLVATTGLSAREIAQAHGLTTLHRLERDALQSALASTTPSVIGAAASVADEAVGRVALASAHDVVLLRSGADVAATRQATGQHRPDVAIDEPRRRAPLYESVATAIVDVDDLDADAVAKRVLATVEGSA